MRADRKPPADAQDVLSVTVGPTAHVDLSIRVTRTAASAVVTPEGEIDSENARQLDAALRAEEAHTEVVLDLRGVSYLSSAAVAVVEDAYARSERAPWTLKIVPGPPGVQQALDRSGLAGRARTAEASAAPRGSGHRSA